MVLLVVEMTNAHVDNNISFQNSEIVFLVEDQPRERKRILSEMRIKLSYFKMLKFYCYVLTL